MSSTQIRILTVCVASWLSLLAAQADLPFRNHRYDLFKVLPVRSDNIVFVGNSITNMHEWWEAFDNPLILNRGVSGAVSDEMLANLDGIAQGQPAKIFLMIGTNDLGTEGLNNSAHVAANVRRALNLIKERSPHTQIYVQSILPTHAGIRTVALEKETNDSLRRISAEVGATYIDLWDDLLPVEREDTCYTLDGLHLQAVAFRTWCRRIAPYVGSPCIYPVEASNNCCGLTRSTGMRASIFAMLPVRADDVLFVGDDMLNGMEWHELLHSPQMKRRATGWGYSTVGAEVSEAMLRGILHGRPDNACPAQIFFYTGMADLRTSKNVETTIARYLQMLHQARVLAPKAELCVMSLLPTDDAQFNAGTVEPFNARLSELTAKLSGTRYIDCYTPFVREGVADTSCIKGNYVYGLGYARLSERLAPVIKAQVRPTTEAEAAKDYAAYGRKQSH